MGLPFPPPEDLPDPGIEPGSPASASGFFTIKPPGKPYRKFICYVSIIPQFLKSLLYKWNYMLYNLSILTLFTQNNSLANHPNYYVWQLCAPFYYCVTL